MISPKIFREYDIRGVVGEDLTKDTARLIGWAFARYLLKVNQCPVSEAGELTVAVGRDVRLHSMELCNGLIDGITSTGMKVVDVGECPSPLLYFSIYNTHVDGGIMVTGSHNPPEFNGFKLCVGKETLHSESIQEIRRIIDSENPVFDAAGGARMFELVEYSEIIPFYIAYLREQFVFPYQTSHDPVKVVVDSGNGTAGVVAPVILREMGCDVIELYSKPDGSFPNHHPDPTIPENLEDLIAAVRDNSADFGVAYDGDADRIGIVDEEGHIIWGDRLMIIFARDILKERPGAVIVSEVKASHVLYDEIEKAGGTPVMWKAGHSLIKAEMKEKGALLGGEVSGHIFFADRFFGYDDAIYATCRLVEILKRERVAAGLSQPEEGMDKSAGLSQPEEGMDKSAGLSQRKGGMDKSAGLSQPEEGMDKSAGLSQPEEGMDKSAGLSQRKKGMDKSAGQSGQAVRRGVSFLLDGVPSTCVTPEIRIPCPDEKKFQVVDEIREFFTSGGLPVQGESSLPLSGEGSPSALGENSPISQVEGLPSSHGDGAPISHVKGEPSSLREGTPLSEVEGVPSSQAEACGYGLNVKDVVTVDGVRVIFEQGWGLIRPSNTQPVLVLRFEADSQERLSEIRSFMEGILKTKLG